MGEVVQFNSTMDLDTFILLNVTIIFIIFIILMNLFLIMGILTDHNMRGRLFFKLILLIAVAHFLQGVLVIPLHIEILSSGGLWTHDPDICTFWHLTDLTLTSVLVLLFLMLVLERFFSLTYPLIVSGKCLGLLMLLTPWILSTGFVVFLYYALPRDFFAIVIDVVKGTERKDTCTLDYYVQGIYSFLGFICPAMYVFGFCWANVVILCLLRRRYAEGPSDDNPRNHTTAASLVAMCFIAMWLPANSGFFIPTEFVSFISGSLALYLGFANAALTPTLWIIVPQIKRRFHRLCCCCCIACCGPTRQRGTVVSSAVDDRHIRMLGDERIQPSATTKL